MTHRFTTTITAAQIDVLGHLNNAAYLTIFEQARWSILQDRGMSWADLVALGVSPVILEVNLKFRREVREGDEVIIETTHTRVGARRFSTVQRMVDNEGKLRASAELSGAFFDVNTRRIVDPPEAMLQAVGLATPPAVIPLVQGLGGAFLLASNADSLAAWYTEVLGIEFNNWGSCRGVELPSADVQPNGRQASTTFALFAHEGPLPSVRNGRVNLRVSDMDLALARLAAAGIAAELAPDESFGRFATVIDPEGNRLELWEPAVLERE